MKTVGQKLMLAAVLALCVFVLQTAAFGGAYDGTAISADLNATRTPDHVTLTWADDPATTMTITWRTASTVRRCHLEYRLQEGDAASPPVRAVISPDVFTTAAGDTVTGSMHVFTTTILGLQPGATYVYRIGTDTGKWTEPRVFTTEAGEALSRNRFKFLLFGDSQSGNGALPDYASWHATLHNAFAANTDARFFVVTGDLVEAGQQMQHWNNWFKAAAGVIDVMPALVVVGNHETLSPRDGKTGRPEYFLRQFHLVQNGPPGFEGRTFSFDYGRCHFAILDSQAREEREDAFNIAGSRRERAFLTEQAEWLEKDLAAHRDALFTFVLLHKPPYSKRGNTVLLKNILCPVFDRHHVDVVFSGHDHVSSRTYPIRNGRIVGEPSRGTVYYLTGRSGKKYYSAAETTVWNAAFFNPTDQPDYQTVELEGKKLTITCFKQDGTRVERYVLDKDLPKDDAGTANGLR